MTTPPDLISTTPTSEIQTDGEFDLEHRLNSTFPSLRPDGTLELLHNQTVSYQASPEPMAPLDQSAPVSTTTTSDHLPYPPGISQSPISSFTPSDTAHIHQEPINLSPPSDNPPISSENLSADHHPPPQVQTDPTTIEINLTLDERNHKTQRIPNQKRSIERVDNPNPNSKSVLRKNPTKKAKQNSKASKNWVYEDSSPKVLPKLEELADQNGNLPSHLVFKLQTTTCVQLPAHLREYQCTPCVRRQPGSICAFKLIRQWICRQDSPNVIVGEPTFPAFTTHPSQLDYQHPNFPTRFTRLPTYRDLMELRRLLAKTLLPAIQDELDWLKDSRVKFIGRRIDLVTKCDYCSATLIGAAWLCSRCGAEACPRCFDLLTEQVQADADGDKSTTTNSIHVDWLNRLTTCNRKTVAHGPDTHFKISHITRGELETLRDQMLALAPAQLSQTITTSTTPPEDPAPYSVPVDLLTFLYQPEDSHSESYIKIHVKDLEADPSIFDRLWSAGIMILVTGMSDRMQIDWTPAYFTWKYASNKCQMIESNSPLRPPKETTVQDFFDTFQKERSPNQPIWKLRDWPPEADFRSNFPELFYDFEQALPIPDITARFGIRNVAGHFPTNANVPDIGPKMYIAMKNSDQVGSRGSTVLHMDVADAVNIQTYARLGESEGCALWHLYHAKDSQVLREFLYQHQADELQIPVEDIKRMLDDPIHTTRIYIDAEMRKTLREKYGVKGWEVKQKPGEAVFIPAYTAHQVCNLANCIKVAADFVSPHSIERCIQLAEEFRVQNHEHRNPWREDLLQINQMLLYAFMSTGRNPEEFEVENLKQD